jgi:signal transduction histidine kinase
MSSDPTIPLRTVPAAEMSVQQIHTLESENFEVDLDQLVSSCIASERLFYRFDPSPKQSTGTEVTLPQSDIQDQLLGAIARRLSHIFDLEDLIETATQTLGELLQVDRVEIIQYLPQQAIWRHVGEYRRNPDEVSVLQLDIPDSDHPLATRLKQLESIQVGPTTHFPDASTPYLARLFPDVWLFLPLRVDGLWGYLSVMQHRSTAWTSEEITLMQALVEHISASLAHVQHYQQVRQLNEKLEHTVHCRTQQLRQALANESMLKRVTDKVRDSLDETQILQTIVEELAALLNLEYCDTGIYNLSQNTCTIAYDYTTVMPSAQGTVVEMSTHYPDVYHQLLLCQPVQFCLQAQDSESQLSGYTILACPIFDNRGVLGDLWLFRPVTQAFNELEVRLVQQVTNQCAIAIRQARLHQAAQTQVESLEYVHQLKDTFLSTVSHELRTPISTIKMAIQMLTLTLGREGLLPDPSKPSLSSSKIAHYLKILNDECNREIGLITDLLDLQQLEAGNHTLSVQSIQLSPYLHRIVLPFQEQAAQLGQTLIIDIAPDLPDVQSDVQSLERILVEFLTNACKYTATGEVIRLTAQAVMQDESNHSHFAVSHRRTTTTTSGLIRIAVANSGVEIPTDQLEQVFDKFYRIPKHDPHQHSGTGLGLALVKKLAPQIGSRITAESGQGQTCFAIELPILGDY